MTEPAATACCVVVMAKAPERAKRRLAAEIGDRAVTVARHLYQCVLEDVADWPGAVCLAPAAAADVRTLELPAHRTALVVPQGDGNLGERIARVSAALHLAGHTRQIFIGTDCPELDADYLQRAASGLATHDVVLGPARDGGVVLMGAARPWPELDRLPWSTPSLCAALVDACAAQGLRTLLLEERGDVDTAADLIAALPRLRGDARPTRQALRGWLATQADLGG